MTDSQSPAEAVTADASDSIQRFMFRDLDIRGELAHLDDTWSEVNRAHAYPLPVQRLLGELLTATALLANIIKVKGTLTVQATGDGPLSVLMAECQDRETLRAIARIKGDVSGPLPPPGTSMGTELLGKGLLTITIRPEDGEPYQGIVPLTGATLAEVMEAYFAQSEQIPTRLWLSAEGDRAAGLLIQALPTELAQAVRSPAQREEDFTRVTLLADTLGAEELRVTANETLLHRLFHEETVVVQAPAPVAFHCSCTRDRTREALRAMPQAELEEIVATEGEITMDCQFCHTVYRFDGIDLTILFRADAFEAPADAEDPPAH
ncbi:MAG TPA: Hsp33 family molecular chaperone HslO [Pseudomonadales bacterium]|nr:Hsp33 family molecular chaperone HslO [Pseudomonadales bacterium]